MLKPVLERAFELAGTGLTRSQIERVMEKEGYDAGIRLHLSGRAIGMKLNELARSARRQTGPAEP
jgi:hypothetical protein